jgi:elongation factor G
MDLGLNIYKYKIGGIIMKEYSVKNLRNICLMSHGGAGKTTLTEAMLYNAGLLDRFGKVLDGNTTTDFDAEEIKRQISISTAIAPCEWNNNKINIIDTPGYFDFVGEIKQGVRVAEGAVILVAAKGGLQVGTEKSWAYAEEQSIPRMFFISKMDEEHANFEETFSQLADKYGNKVIAFQLPIFEGENFTGIVDIVNMKAKKFDKNKSVEIDIPAALNDKVSSSLSH